MGMTRIFEPSGRAVGATAVEAGPCRVVRVKTPDVDGYAAVLLGWGEVVEKSLNRPELGQFVKAGLAPMKRLTEFRVDVSDGFEVGQVVDLADRFQAGDFVDVSGTSKGKGFQGVMKRHGFHGMPASHGSSDKERSPGSLAGRRSLGRVLPGKRMAGRMGGVRVTVQKVQVVGIEPAKNLIYLHGPVPGPQGSFVVLQETVKALKHRKPKAAAPATAAKGARTAAKAKAKPAPAQPKK